jgi:hypothetical protein
MHSRRRLELGVTAVADRGPERLDLGEEDRRVRKADEILSSPLDGPATDCARIDLGTRQRPSSPCRTTFAARDDDAHRRAP